MFIEENEQGKGVVGCYFKKSLSEEVTFEQNEMSGSKPMNI